MPTGFADLHNHQFAHLAFGGRVVWGGAYGDASQQLGRCRPFHGPHGVVDVVGNVLRVVNGGSILSILGHRTGGHPEFDGWPRWDSATHQSVFADWLYRAVQGGLRLMVMLAVNNEYVCRRVCRTRGRSCDDMKAVELQLQAATEMEAYLDGDSGGHGRGWYRIVRTPDEARAVIQAGKLAVVLGIEVDHLFNCRTEGDLSERQLRQELDRYYAMGVRHVFPIHYGDNGFGGGAFQVALIRDAEGGLISRRNPLGTLGAYTIRTEDGHSYGYEYRTGRRNAKGLTGLGKTLIRELIHRGMVIDIDHMSAKSKADTLDLCETADYPVVAGHAGFVEISSGGKRHEGQLLPEEADRIRRLDGMVAIIVNQGKLHEIQTWRTAGQPVIEHTCGGTSNTLVQVYRYTVAKMQGRPVGLGTDFNGFAGLPGPRFGPDAAPGGQRGPAPDNPVRYPFTAATGVRMDPSVIGQKAFVVNTDGLAHVGMLPDLIADLQAQGLTPTDLGPLLHSAEGYVALWDKAWSRSTCDR
jgi:microsomal dipeptidase-like Zn-dependent dipeptidase